MTMLRQSHLLKNLGTYAFLILMGLFVLFPLVMTLSQSLMTVQQVNHFPPPIIPTSPTLDSYVRAFAQPDLHLFLWLGNSIYAASAYTLAVIVICTPAAFAFARLKFPAETSFSDFFC